MVASVEGQLLQKSLQPDAECRVLSSSRFLFMFSNTSHQTSLVLSPK